MLTSETSLPSCQKHQFNHSRTFFFLVFLYSWRISCPCAVCLITFLPRPVPPGFIPHPPHMGTFLHPSTRALRWSYIFKVNPFPLVSNFVLSLWGKVFANEVNSHREQIIELDKTGTHLKYFSQKQDVVLIKNLLISVQSRWEKVVQRLVERGRSLDDARKRAKQVINLGNVLWPWQSVS